MAIILLVCLVVYSSQDKPIYYFVWVITFMIVLFLLIANLILFLFIYSALYKESQITHPSKQRAQSVPLSIPILLVNIILIFIIYSIAHSLPIESMWLALLATSLQVGINLGLGLLFSGLYLTHQRHQTKSTVLFLSLLQSNFLAAVLVTIISLPVYMFVMLLKQPL